MGYPVNARSYGFMAAVMLLRLDSRILWCESPVIERNQNGICSVVPEVPLRPVASLGQKSMMNHLSIGAKNVDPLWDVRCLRLGYIAYLELVT
jgi:hypothetical protein